MREEIPITTTANISSPIALKRPPQGFSTQGLRACHKWDGLSESLFRNEIADTAQKEHPRQGNVNAGIFRASIKSPINAPKAQPSPALAETPVAARGRNRQSLCQKHASKGDHRTDGEIDPTERITKVMPTAMIPRKALSVRYCRSLLWKQNRETGSGSKDNQHKDADGDHQWQITFYHGYDSFNQTDKALRLDNQHAKNHTAFTTWFISGGKPESKIPVLSPE